MKRDSLIIILAFVGAGIFLVIGFIGMVGISQPVTIRSGSCEKTYSYYYVGPFLRDYLDSVPTKLLEIRNAKIDVIQCLCADRVKNAEAIVTLMKEARSEYPYGLKTDTNDVNVICDNEAVEYHPM